MKSSILPIIGLLLIEIGWSQVITSDPPYPTEKDSIVIYFDASQAVRDDLVEYTGDLYVHTGVYSSEGNWKHVIGNWGDNITQPKLTRLYNDVYKLVIGYPREFYSVTSPGEKIYSFCFVFRSSDASRQTEDIFYELYEPGLTAIFQEPVVDIPFGDPKRSPLFLCSDDSLTIVGTAAALGTMIDTLRLQYEGTDIKITSDYVLIYKLMGNLLHSGINEFLLIASDTVNIQDTTHLTLVQNPPIQDSVLPSGIRPGITILNDQSAVLALFAPYKEFIYVIGDFNDWMVDTDYFMNRYYVSDDSVVFWLQVDSLNPSTEYGFQYLIDGELRIADPYTEKILDPWNDKYIDDSIYPDLKEYPAGKTSEAVATFQTVKNEWTWTNTDWDKPEKKDLVIYELLVRDFIAKHDYSTLIDTLNYLENLGINAIELMPVSEFEGNSSWGYNPSFHLALDKYYGPPDDFKRFVDECHARGIAVIMDMVLNHAYGQLPLVRMYWNLQQSRPAANNPWFNEVSPNTSYSWGSDFNHESKHTKAYVDRVNRYWIDEFHVDGFRFDFTKGFTNKSGDGWAYDAARIAILKRMSDAIWSVDSTSYVILEHFADNSEEKILSDYGMMLWGNSNWNYAQSAMGYSSESDFSWGFYKNRSWSDPHLVTYMESHDEERLMYKNLAYGNSSGTYNIKNLETALQRQKLVNAFFLTLPGPKMIWQFGELGFDVSIDDPCRVCEKDPVWDYSEDVYRRSLYKTVAALLKLRRENDVFTSPNTTASMSVGGNGKRIILNGSPNAVIIGNFGVTALSIAPNFQHAGNWYDYFSGDTQYIEITTDPIELAPGEFHIFTDRKLETPDPGLINGIDDDIQQYPAQFVLRPNYPNPFNATTTFRYEVEKQSDLQIRIFDLNGREVYSGNRFSRNPGRYSFVWNGRNNEGRILQSGVYFLMLQRDNERKVQKITLLK